MGNFENIGAIQDTNDKLSSINDVLSELDNKNDNQSRELTKQVLELEDIINSINGDDRLQYSKEIEALKKEMIELGDTGNIISTDYEEIKNIQNIEATKENLSQISIDGIDYKVGDNYTMRGLRQFGLYGKNVILEGIYKFTKEDGSDGYKGVSSSNGMDYDLTFFKEAKDSNDIGNSEIVNKLKEGNYSAIEVFTQNEELFNYIHSKFDNADIITDNMVSILKEKIVDYANSYDIQLKEDFKITMDRNEAGKRCFTIDQKDIITDLGDENTIELFFGD